MLSYTTLQNLIQIARMVIDIAIIALLLYYCLKIVRNNSRTVQIFKGILFVILMKGIATFFGLKTVQVVADILVQWGFLAIIIIFQPEIRSILERLGKSNVFSRIATLSGNERETLVDQLVEASMSMASQRVGALITIEQSQSLSDYIKTGTPMNSIVTADLLNAIFVTTTPLHDGAVIIQGDKIACASAYFLPTDRNLPRRYGARHRAAIGISEITDAISIVVSEETGTVSIAQSGELTKMTDVSLRNFLLRIICHEEVEHGDRGLIKKEMSSERRAQEEAIYKEIISQREEKMLTVEKEQNSETKEEKKPAQKADDKGILSIFRKKKEPKSKKVTETKPEEAAQPSAEPAVSEPVQPDTEEPRDVKLEFSADETVDINDIDYESFRDQQEVKKDE